MRIALVEAVPFESASQPSFDERTIALSRSSQKILAGIGVWPEISAQACPIREIHVSERSRFGSAVICGEEQGLGELGYVGPAIATLITFALQAGLVVWVAHGRVGSAPLEWKRIGAVLVLVLVAMGFALAFEANSAGLGWTRLAFENGQTGWVRKEDIVSLWQ